MAAPGTVPGPAERVYTVLSLGASWGAWPSGLQARSAGGRGSGKGKLALSRNGPQLRAFHSLPPCPTLFPGDREISAKFLAKSLI